MLPWIKLVHLLAMLMWFGTLMIVHGTMARNLSSREPSVRNAFAAAIDKFNLRYMLPGILLSVATGLWMVFAFYGIRAGYIHAKLGLGLLGAVVSLYSIADFRGLRRQIASRGAEPGALPRKAILRWRLTTMAAAALLLGTLVSAMLKF